MEGYAGQWALQTAPRPLSSWTPHAPTPPSGAPRMKAAPPATRGPRDDSQGLRDTCHPRRTTSTVAMPTRIKQAGPLTILQAGTTPNRPSHPPILPRNLLSVPGNTLQELHPWRHKGWCVVWRARDQAPLSHACLRLHTAPALTMGSTGPDQQGNTKNQI